MRENMTQSEQVKWVLGETARQILLFPVRAFVAINNAGVDRTVDAIRAIWARNDLQKKFDALTDETFLDRALMPDVEVSIHGSDEATLHLMEVARAIQRTFPKPRKSLDGIFQR